MHKNKLKLIIFVQAVAIYCLFLYYYLKRNESNNNYEVNELKDGKLSSLLRISIHDYVQLTIKYDLPLSMKNAEMYGVGVGPRRGEPLNTLMTGFECSKFRIDELKRTVQLWNEFVPNGKVYLLSKENCEFFETMPRNLIHKILVVERESELEQVLSAQTRGANFFDVTIDLGQIETTSNSNFLTIWNKLRPASLGIYVFESIHNNYSGKKAVDKMLNIINGLDLPKEDLAAEFKSITQSLLSVNCYINSCYIVKK